MKDPPPVIDVSHKSSKHSFGMQSLLLVQRYVRNLIREPQSARANIGQTVLVGLIMGLTFLHLNFTNTAIQNRTGCLFFCCVFLMFGGLLGPFFMFPAERKVMIREYLSGLYSPTAYYLSKIIAEQPIFLFNAILFSCITYWLIGFNPKATSFIIFIVIMYLLTNVAFSFGVFVISAFPDPVVAINIFPIFFIPLMIFSGFYLNSKNTPKYFIWIEYLSFLKYGFRALMNNEFKGESYHCTTEELSINSGVCPFEQGIQILQFYDMTSMPIIGDACILLGMIVGYHILAYFLLTGRTKRLK